MSPFKKKSLVIGPKRSNGQDRFFVPKKRFGQNFLIDQKIRDKIVASCGLTKDDVVLEIGPGTGALTRLIAPLVKELIAVETDRELYEHLKKEFTGQDHVRLIYADILRYDFSQLPLVKIKVIGNLPYYISTPIITKVFEHHKHFSQLFMTVQLEFGQRLIAQPSSKDYSSFSCFCQYYADIQNLFAIKAKAFRPIHKVDSCFMRFDIASDPKHQVSDETFLFKVIRQAFNQRRKTLVNSLASAVPKDRLTGVLETLKISPLSRAENLSLSDYVRLANILKRMKSRSIR